MADHAVAAIAYRDGAAGPEFVLVRAKHGPWWTFPKGHVEKRDETPGAAALREAREEAGVIGALVEDAPFTRYRYVKSRSGKEQDVDAYLVKVKRAKPPDEPDRGPVWVTAAEARTRFATGHNTAEHRRVLAAALRRLTSVRGRTA